MSHLVSDSGCCPMCGQANDCSLTANCAAEPVISKHGQFSCWCMAYPLSENARNSLKQKLSEKQSSQQASNQQDLAQQNLPLQHLSQEQAQPKACLCQRCLADIARQP